MLLKWVSTMLRQRARQSSSPPAMTYKSTWTTRAMSKSTNLFATMCIIAAFLHLTNGFTPIEMNSAEGRKLFGGYRITPKHCRATKTLPYNDPRSNGPTICMFNHECAQRNGEVVGACMDGFLFGACCQIPNSQGLETTMLNDAQNAYYQQHQQQKLQQQQSISNPAAAQSYENYGSQSSSENKYSAPVKMQHKRPQGGIYDQTNLNKVYQQLESTTQQQQQQQHIYDQGNTNKVYEQLDSSNNHNNHYQSHMPSSNQYGNEAQNEDSYGQESASPAQSSVTNFDEPAHDVTHATEPSSQQSEQSENTSNNSDASTQSNSSELENDAQVQPTQSVENTNSLSNMKPPSNFQVHKDSVKISSPSSPPHNDDFVMQVLSTLPPDHGNDQIIFTTEVPMKIASSLSDQSSSESNSFEEATQRPVMGIPIKQEQKQQQQHAAQQQQQQEEEEDDHSAEEQKQPQNTKQHSNTHNHNHLLLDAGEFTHSDITHPGADADLIEDDLQFSTGYGPQPVYVKPPHNKQPSSSSYKTSTTPAPAPLAEDQYVLVQTISNEQGNKKPYTGGSPTSTSSSITTHVDSIESIILQLNGSSHGPTYNVVNPQTPTYGGDEVSSASKYEEQSTGYVDATTTTYRPAASPSTNYYDEVETKRPDDYYTENELSSSQQKYPGSQQSQVPAYLEPVTTPLTYSPTPSYDSVEEQKPAEYSSSEYSINKPSDSPISTAATSYGEDSSGVLDEHPMPSNNYDDALQSASHPTSDFNKMPAMGIAYPVDMAYLEEENNAAADSEVVTNYASSTSSKPSYSSSTEKTDVEIDDPYSKVPIIAGTPQRPQATYIGVISSQSYSTKPAQTMLYSQLPEDVSVSSLTTNVQEGYGASPSYQTTRPEKFTTISYVDEAPTTTTRPAYSRPTSASYGSSTATESSTANPTGGIITSSGTKPRPKPRPKPASNRPKRPSTQKTTKRKTTTTAKPSTNYQQEAQPSNTYTQSTVKQPQQPSSDYNDPSYNKQQEVIASQPTNTYGGPPLYYKKKPTPAAYDQHKPAKQPQNSYNQQQQQNQQAAQPSKSQPSTYDQQKPAKQPQNAYQQQQHQQQKPAAQPSNSYNSQNDDTDNTYTKQPSSSSYGTPKPTKKPTNSYQQQQQKKPSAAQPSNSYNTQAPSSKPASHISNPYKPDPPSYDTNQPVQPSLSYNQDQQVASSPTKRPTPTRKAPGKKPVSTSYVTGPTTPRPPTTFVYHDEAVPPLVIADDKLDSFVQSTAAAVAATAAPTVGSYQQSIYLSSVTPVHIQRPQNGYKKPGFVKVTGTAKPPTPTVLITPKPTVINLVTASSWGTQALSSSNIDSAYPATTPIPPLGSTSYIYSPLVTRRPVAVNTQEYVSLPSISTNDFDDPGYYGGNGAVHPAFTQVSTEASYGVPSNDRPAFPGYYGPTPTYPPFMIPGDKIGSPVEEETYTSPNDFVNFPPVRNPNLNMSATSSAVTTDLELSTPAFVEDGVLKDKMNTLVHKIVESLQGNFDALADMIDDANHTAAPANTYAASQATASTTATRKPTRKPTTRVTTAKPKATTKRPATRATTKAPTRRPSTVATRRTTTTRKPATRKPTRRTTTTTSAPFEDEIIDEEDDQDVNPADNEIGDQEEAFTGAGGRKFKCGVRPHIKSGRIVGGKGSTFGAYPWQVLVRESTWLGLFTKNKCGGVLITNRYVITAAHCQPGFLASLVAVMGEFDISVDLESKRSVTKNVKRVIVHRQYDPATFENDLALLELESPVQFDTHIVPICMPNDHADFTGRMATVTGWGRLKYGGGVPSVLQEVQVPVIENSVCQEMFHTAGHNKKILSSFLCAGYANGQKDSCEGDSGGPLVLQRPDGRYELAGTVSHGIKCAAPYLPGVYMRTTFYKPWLRSITGVK